MKFSERNRRRCESPQGFNHPLDSWSMSDWCTATVGEVGEAANVVKKLNRCRDGIPGNDKSEAELRQMLADEIADAAIYLDLWAQASGFDLEAIRDAKFAKKSAKIGYIDPFAAQAAQPSESQPGEQRTTKDFAEVIRAKMAADPALAADVERARIYTEGEQSGYQQALDDIEGGRTQPIREVIDELRKSAEPQAPVISLWEAFEWGWSFRSRIGSCHDSRDIGRLFGCHDWPQSATFIANKMNGFTTRDNGIAEAKRLIREFLAEPQPPAPQPPAPQPPAPQPPAPQPSQACIDDVLTAAAVMGLLVSRVAAKQKTMSDRHFAWDELRLTPKDCEAVVSAWPIVHEAALRRAAPPTPVKLPGREELGKAIYSATRNTSGLSSWEQEGAVVRYLCLSIADAALALIRSSLTSQGVPVEKQENEGGE